MWVSVLLLGAAEHLVSELRGWVEVVQTHGAEVRVELKKALAWDVP